MSDPAFRCAQSSRERGDSMIATAPTAPRWLLIEREGAWPVRALDAFTPSDAAALERATEEHDVRIALIRRPGRHPRQAGEFRWAAVDVRRGQEGIRWHKASTVSEVLATSWDVSPGEGEPVALVCSHSRHDLCCALQGRPVATALDGLRPGRVWESSHLGGHRFAATMVILPTGLCYGRLDARSAAAAMDAFERGDLVPDHLRGRCADPREVQAATALAMAAGLIPARIDALRPGHVEVRSGVTSVRFSSLDVKVRFRDREVDLPTPVSCSAEKLGRVREYDLLDAR